MRLVMLGPPGSGKGTQGQALALEFGVPHIATGEIVRDHIARGTEFGRKIQAQIAAGNFASDEDILYWVSRRLSEPDASVGYILDGFPRDRAQAEAFDAPLNAVVDLLIGDDELITRLSGRLVCPQCETAYHVVYQPPITPGLCDHDGAELVRRPDDAPDAVRNRLRIYHQVTEPLQKYYSHRQLLVPVEALGEPSAVTQRILSALSVRTLAKHDF
jgi:adenylate kinase